MAAIPIFRGFGTISVNSSLTVYVQAFDTTSATEAASLNNSVSVPAISSSFIIGLWTIFYKSKTQNQ